ncbi:MAG: hypothetical protein V3W28_00935 [Thermoplasmata archaeon]
MRSIGCRERSWHPRRHPVGGHDGRIAIGNLAGALSGYGQEDYGMAPDRPEVRRDSLNPHLDSQHPLHKWKDPEIHGSGFVPCEGTGGGPLLGQEQPFRDLELRLYVLEISPDAEEVNLEFTRAADAWRR